ncbi:MAG: hypothetical protein ACREXQ_05690, partial [Polaromonas sp.]
TYRLKEVLMSTTLKSPRRAIQLTLFRPVRNEPGWESVPIEIQQQVLRLVARMLRDHVARQGGEPAPQEDRDE